MLDIISEEDKHSSCVWWKGTKCQCIFRKWWDQFIWLWRFPTMEERVAREAGSRVRSSSGYTRYITTAVTYLLQRQKTCQCEKIYLWKGLNRLQVQTGENRNIFLSSVRFNPTSTIWMKPSMKSSRFRYFADRYTSWKEITLSWVELVV